MTDQTDRLIEEVQSKNKGENYERENTIDNITEHLMRKFNSILSR